MYANWYEDGEQLLWLNIPYLQKVNIQTYFHFMLKIYLHVNYH